MTTTMAMANTPRSRRGTKVSEFSSASGRNEPDFPAIPLWTLWSIWDPKLSELVQTGERGSAKRQRLHQTAFHKTFLARFKELPESFNFPEITDFLTVTVEITDEIYFAEHRGFVIIPIRFCDFEDSRAPKENWTIKAYAKVGILLYLTFKRGDIILILGGFIDHAEKEIVLNRTPTISHILHLADHNATCPINLNLPFGKAWNRFVKKARLQRITFPSPNFYIQKTIPYLHQNVLPSISTPSSSDEPAASVPVTSLSSRSPMVVLNRINQSHSPVRVTPRETILVEDSHLLPEIEVLEVLEKLDSQEILADTPPSSSERNSRRHSDIIEVVDSEAEDEVEETNRVKCKQRRASPKFTSTPRASALPGGFFPEDDEIQIEDEDEQDVTIRPGQTTQTQTKSQSPVPGPSRRITRMALPKTNSSDLNMNWHAKWRCNTEDGKDKYKYDTLLAHNDKLGKGHFASGRPQECVYGVVAQVLQERANSYRIRISDSTMKGVLVRIHASMQEPKIGPEIKVKDIIRLHRCRIQSEYMDHGGSEMVISTTPHHNYVLFNYDPERKGRKILHASSAKKITLTASDKIRVKELGKFAKDKDCLELLGTSVHSTQSAHNHVGNGDRPDQDSEEEHIRTPEISPSSSRKSHMSPESSNRRGRTRSQTSVSASPISSASVVSAATAATRGSSLRSSLSDSDDGPIRPEFSTFVYLKDLRENMTPFAMKCRFLASIYDHKTDELLIRVSDINGTALPDGLKFANYEKLSAALEQEPVEVETPFVDISIRNIEDNPALTAEIYLIDRIPYIWILKNIKIIPQENGSGAMQLIVESGDKNSSLEKYVDENRPEFAPQPRPLTKDVGVGASTNDNNVPVPPTVAENEEEDEDLGFQSPKSTVSSYYESCVSHPLGGEQDDDNGQNDTTLKALDQTVIQTPQNESEDMEVHPSDSPKPRSYSLRSNGSPSPSKSSPVRSSYSLRSSSSEPPSPKKVRRCIRF